jgi:hypothetical protein
MYILKKANVFDPVAEVLSPDLFDGDRLLPERRLQLLEIVKQLTPDPVSGVFILGSMLGYQYSDTADVDMWALVEDEHAVTMTGTAGLMLPGTQHPVNIKFMTAAKMAPDKSTWTVSYDVVKDEWVNSPSVPSKIDVNRFNVNKPYLNMLVREMNRQTAQMHRAYGTPRLLKEVRDVTNIYRKLDLSRKFVYDAGIGAPKKSIRNAAYKYMEREAKIGHNASVLERYIRKVLDKNK